MALEKALKIIYKNGKTRLESIIMIIVLIVFFMAFCTYVIYDVPPRTPETQGVLASLQVYCEFYKYDYSGQLPHIEDIREEKGVVNYVGKKRIYLPLTFPMEQPYKSVNIYLFRGYKHGKYLYTNKIPDKDILKNYLYIYACNAAKKIVDGIYIAHKAKEYHDYWVVVTLDSEDLPYVIHSPIPPFPGCLLDANNEVYYPSEMLSALKKYYPSIDIPEDKIIR